MKSKERLLMKIFTRHSLILTTIVTLTLTSAQAWAQSEEEKKDSTGTNPINFSKDIRVYNEYSVLNTEGDGTQNQTTAEIRLPLLDGKWQWRLRARLNSIEAVQNSWQAIGQQPQLP